MPRHHEQPPEGRGMQRVRRRAPRRPARPRTAPARRSWPPAPGRRAAAPGACSRARPSRGRWPRMASCAHRKPGERAAPSGRPRGRRRGDECLGANGERQEADSQEHLQQEDPSLQHGDDRADLADAVDQEECRQRIDGGTHRRWGQPPHDEHGREQDRHPHRIHDHARRVRVDPDRAHQGHHQRRGQRRRSKTCVAAASLASFSARRRAPARARRASTRTMKKTATWNGTRASWPARNCLVRSR